MEDFITRTANLGVNKRAIENFIKAGAFDSLNATRKQMMMVYIQILDGVNKENKDAWEARCLFLIWQMTVPKKSIK